MGGRESRSEEVNARGGARGVHVRGKGLGVCGEEPRRRCLPNGQLKGALEQLSGPVCVCVHTHTFTHTVWFLEQKQRPSKGNSLSHRIKFYLDLKTTLYRELIHCHFLTIVL